MVESVCNSSSNNNNSDSNSEEGKNGKNKVTYTILDMLTCLCNSQ